MFQAIEFLLGTGSPLSYDSKTGGKKKKKKGDCYCKRLIYFFLLFVGEENARWSINGPC